MTQYRVLGFKRYILMFPTWRCNLSCPYCPYSPKPLRGYVDVYTNASKMSMKEIPSKDWTGFLSPMEDSLVEICGGEPLLYNGISQVIDSLHPSSRYAVTSNSTQMKTIFKLNPNNCYGWTASYHPSAPQPYSDLGFFLGVLREMKEYGFRNVACTIVYLPWKHTDEYVAAMQKRFKGEGVPLNWQPYMWPGYTWRSEKRGVALKLMPKYRPDWDGGRLKTCGAGGSAFAVNSDGAVYRCLSSISFKDKCLGNIRRGWTPVMEASECRSPCVYTCDYWNNEVTYVDEATVTVP